MFVWFVLNTNIALTCLFYPLTESALDRDTDRDSSNSDSESKQIQGTLLKIDFFFCNSPPIVVYENKIWMGDNSYKHI
jgi:hypothetical protein